MRCLISSARWYFLRFLIFSALRGWIRGHVYSLYSSTLHSCAWDANFITEVLIYKMKNVILQARDSLQKADRPLNNQWKIHSRVKF